ncbi:MAG TPA: hypothetical protein VMW27_27385 [Thermoanaerobaculia bacterium]|nr:hypothetical protein [Thermoanaerobaculia bacterium]
MRNAFDAVFLELLDQRDEPANAAEAEAAGPWHVMPAPGGGWAVVADGESPDEGDEPAAVLRDRDLALLVAAVLPGTGRDPLVRLGKDAEPGGYPLQGEGGVLGHLRLFNEDLAAAVNVLELLRRSPLGLARLLAAAGGLALARTGKILRREALEAGEG